MTKREKRYLKNKRKMKLMKFLTKLLKVVDEYQLAKLKMQQKGVSGHYIDFTKAEENIKALIK